MNPPMVPFTSAWGGTSRWAVCQNAKGHFDLVAHSPNIYTDNRQIMQEGKIIVPEPDFIY